MFGEVSFADCGRGVELKCHSYQFGKKLDSDYVDIKIGNANVTVTMSRAQAQELKDALNEVALYEEGWRDPIH